MREIGSQRYKYWLSTWWAAGDIDIALVSNNFSNSSSSHLNLGIGRKAC